MPVRIMASFMGLSGAPCDHGTPSKKLSYSPGGTMVVVCCACCCRPPMLSSRSAASSAMPSATADFAAT